MSYKFLRYDAGISELLLPAIVIQILQSIKELVCHTFNNKKIVSQKLALEIRDLSLLATVLLPRLDNIWMVGYLVDHLTNHIIMMVPFTAAAEWLWQISKPYPWEPLRKGLGKGGLRGFCLV
jgi:hypothetical protein